MTREARRRIISDFIATPDTDVTLERRPGVSSHDFPPHNAEYIPPNCHIVHIVDLQHQRKHLQWVKDLYNISSTRASGIERVSQSRFRTDTNAGQRAVCSKQLYGDRHCVSAFNAFLEACSTCGPVLCALHGSCCRT
jgi:hypothetical protein